MKKISSLLVCLLTLASISSGANAAVSCTACVSDGGYGYVRTCCENRVDQDGDPYEYCRTEDCLPGMDVPDKLREGDAPGFTRPAHYPFPDLIYPKMGDKTESGNDACPTTDILKGQ
jgi:hypothetical protein